MSDNTDRRSLAERIASPAPGRVGQATAIEQSRAVAEVLAAVERAARAPRDMAAAVERMREACRIKGLAERAFFSYRRAGSNITGSTVHLARELARVWTNVAYGLAELDRDDAAGVSQMLAFAWDLESNVRSSSVFIVPHVRDKDGSTSPLVSVRDVYENNANMGARRVREQVFAVLPKWFVDDAEQLCRQTLADGGGTPLPKRIATLTATFDERLRVSVEQLVAHVGRPVDRWTPVDVVNLEILGRSLVNGEQDVDEVFDRAGVTSDAIRAQSARGGRRNGGPAAPSAEQQPDPGAEHDPTVEPGWPGEPLDGQQ